MQILLSPDSEKPDGLRKAYDRAFKSATELYVASAYLTDWSMKGTLSPTCRRAVFLIGTDFSLTRTAALRTLLKWIPKRNSVLLLAVPKLSAGGFHPKVVVWRSGNGSHHCILGSSNLSKSAFDVNYEANAVSRISAAEYARLSSWLDAVSKQAIPITEDWINNHYREAAIQHTKSAAPIAAIKLQLPAGESYRAGVRARRRQQAKFVAIKTKLLTAARRCSKGVLTNAKFWERFWNLWANHESRFQGSGIQFSGKAARWREACTALVKAVDARRSASEIELDHIVAEEIDRLAKLGNPARGAWLSEMLCHYMPGRYPVLNSPVRKWLAANKWRGRRGASEGQRYAELARKLREAVRRKPAGVRDLAELDAVIWQWVDNRDL